MSSRFAWCLAALLSTLAFVDSAMAQHQPQPGAGRIRMQQPQMPMMHQGRPFSGTVVAVAGNNLQITTEANHTLGVMTGPNTEIHVTGTAAADYLRAGLYVEFVAEIEVGGKVKQPIDKLTIISATNDRPMGLSNDLPKPRKKPGEGGPPEGRAAGDDVPPVPDPGIAEPAGPGKGPRKTRTKPGNTRGGESAAGGGGKAAGGAVKLPGTFVVRGQVKSCKNNALTVATGRGPTIKFEVSPSAQIDVDAADLRLVSKDDKVTGEGQLMQNRIMAIKLNVECSNPLSGAKKSTRPERPSKTPAAPPHRSKKDAKDPADPLG